MMFQLSGLYYYIKQGPAEFDQYQLSTKPQKPRYSNTEGWYVLFNNYKVIPYRVPYYPSTVLYPQTVSFL